MTMYGREGEADGLITTLLHDKDPILRYGAMYTIAFAFACTGSNSALRRLLHVAVSDVSNDVRRAAVTAIGFVLAATPAQTPKVVKLLAESYNPHVRYGCTLAVGISCAGTGLKDALDLLSPMLSDPVDFVRQGALIATSMVLMQACNHAPDSRLSEHRKHLAKVIADKHEDSMAKFGAIIASGLLDAGGRNMTISLISKSGHKSMSSIVGMAVFTHFWFWHPLLLFASLALTPTAAIGINADLQMPRYRFRSNMPPTTFAYPPMTSADKKQEKKEGPKAELSTTSKAAKRAARPAEEVEAEKREAEAKAAKEREEAVVAARDAMLATLGALEKSSAITPALKASLCGAPPPAAAGKDAAAPMETDAAPLSMVELLQKARSAHDAGKLSSALHAQLVAHKPPPAEGEEEPPALEFEVLDNPARVLRAQERHMSLLPGARYVPVAAGRRAGIIVLKDTAPDEEEDLLQATAQAPPGANADEEEPSPPAPFEFTG